MPPESVYRNATLRCYVRAEAEEWLHAVASCNRVHSVRTSLLYICQLCFQSRTTYEGNWGTLRVLRVCRPEFEYKSCA